MLFRALKPGSHNPPKHGARGGVSFSYHQSYRLQRSLVGVAYNFVYFPELFFEPMNFHPLSEKIAARKPLRDMTLLSSAMQACVVNSDTSSRWSALLSRDMKSTMQIFVVSLLVFMHKNGPRVSDPISWNAFVGIATLFRKVSFWSRVDFHWEIAASNLVWTSKVDSCKLRFRRDVFQS